MRELNYFTLINLLLSSIILILVFFSVNIFFIIVLSTASVILTSFFIFKRIKDFNVDLLFFLSFLSTYLFSLYGFLENRETNFQVTSIIIIVYFITKNIEIRTYEKVKEDFKDIYTLLPRKVNVVNRKERIVDIRDISPGDIVKVGPGNRIPVDGIILEGKSILDESLITGESRPVEKNIGERVIAGTVVLNGLIKIKTERIGIDTYLSQIFEIVKNLESSKIRNRQEIRKPYRLFMFLIILSSISTIFAWKILGNSTYESIERGVTVLVISSNASLVLATHVSVFYSIIKLNRKGIIVKNPRCIELIPEINTFVLDKTGTISESRSNLKIKKMGISKKELIDYLLIAEKNSTHPISRMILNKFRERNIPDPDEFREIHGMGLFAKYKGKEIYVGGRKLLKKLGIRYHENFLDEIFLIVDKKIVGIISFEDTIKTSSKEFINFLKKRNKKIILLTGSNRNSAIKVARDLGIKKVYWDVSPEKKLSIIMELRKSGRIIMIGDGINDAPSLAQADVGISINTDLDIVRESSDIVLTKDDLRLVEEIIIISDFTKKKIKQNLFWTYFYNIFAVLFASGLFIKFGILPTLMTACAASISSTLSIMINSFVFR
ncbi:MAG: cation-translocating P-type ATPase [Candidatus Aenigmatarchaeota archaeon]